MMAYQRTRDTSCTTLISNRRIHDKATIKTQITATNTEIFRRAFENLKRMLCSHHAHFSVRVSRSLQDELTPMLDIETRHEWIFSALICTLMNIPSLFNVHCRMSEETKTVLSSETPEVVPSASAEAHQASSDSSPDVVTNDVRTLQDVERDIQEEKAQLDRARKEYREDQSDYEALLAASREDPNNKALSVQLDNARKFRDFSKKLIDISARCLAWLEGDLAEMQAALFEQKGKYLLCRRKPTIPLNYFRNYHVIP